MKLHHLCVVMLTGCVAEATVGEGSAPAEDLSEEALSRFTVDSTALALRPAAAAPAKALRLEKLEAQNIGAKLLRAPASPSVFKAGARAQLRVADWELETDSKTGRVLANRRVASSGREAAQDVASLRADALSRLQAFGVESEEVGNVVQRTLMSSTQDGTSGASAPKVHSYKTFVFRAVNGIPVQGHRAVITHALDGSARKVLVTWPALAKTGHRLTTRLGTAAIETRAKIALARLGHPGGKAQLSWRYVPVRTDTGEVTLQLVAVAALPGAKLADGTTEEARVVEVGVDAE